MAAQEITVASAKLYYGTDAEINALSGTIGDVGFVTSGANVGAEYTCLGGTSWLLTRAAINGAALVLAGHATSSQANADIDQVLETIATIDVSAGSRLGAQIAVAGQALDQLKISARFHASGAYQTIYDSAGTGGIFDQVSGDLTTIAAAASGWFLLDVTGIESIQIQAACAADNGSSTVYWSIN
jgi:hypothetical protein